MRAERCLQKERSRNNKNGGFCPRKMLMGTDGQACSAVTRALGYSAGLTAFFSHSEAVNYEFQQKQQQKASNGARKFHSREECY